MIQHFRGKNSKDTETASETILLNNGYVINPPKGYGAASKINITLQQNIIENFESYTEKKYNVGGPSGTRTPDQPVMSRLL
jgi:hypothetical protein